MAELESDESARSLEPQKVESSDMVPLSPRIRARAENQPRERSLKGGRTRL